MAGMILSSSCRAQELNCDLETMSEELILMADEEQEVRREIMPLIAQYQKDGSGKMKLFAKAMSMEKLDKENQETLQSYLESCGWQEQLHPDAHNAIYLILQHSPEDMMTQYFPLVKERMDQGHLDPDDWATMLDRLKMYSGEPQIYGTQTFADDDNVNWVWPVANLDSLEIKRAQVFLPDMETYFKIAKDSTGVVMKWDREMTIEEARKMKSN